MIQTHNFSGTSDSKDAVPNKNQGKHTAGPYGKDSVTITQGSQKLKHIFEDMNTSDAIFDSAAKKILSYRAVAARLIYLILDDPELTYEDVLEAIPPRGEGSDFAKVKIEAQEYLDKNEIHVIYDVLFKTLKTKKIKFDFYADFEPQGNYSMPYSIASRGVVYLSKLISSQVDIRTREEANNYQDYDKVVKCYSIWLCFDKLMDEKQHKVCGVTRYKMQPCLGEGLRHNPEEAAHADLMELIIVRAGIPEDSSLDSELLNCVNTFFKYTDNLPTYINNKTICIEISKEVNNMSSLIEKMYEDGIAEGIAKGRVEGRVEGAVEICFSLGMSVPDIIRAIMKKFNFSENVAKDYVNEYQTKAQA